MKHIQAERYVQPIPEWVERTEWMKQTAAQMRQPSHFPPEDTDKVDSTPPTLH